ncbi:Nucleoside-specific channel-forming protein [Candidatus Hepatincola sp. Av]
MNFLYLLILITTTFIATILRAEEGDFATLNLRYMHDMGTTTGDNLNHTVDGINHPGNYVEIEGIAKRGQWDLYGFTDLRQYSGAASGTEAGDHGDSHLGIDFYKYIVGYDVFDNGKLYIRAEAKDTYTAEGDFFGGVGTSVELPVVGHLLINMMYYTGDLNSANPTKKPWLLQFAWFNKLFDLNKDWWIGHAGWSDVDFFTSGQDCSYHSSGTCATQWQFLEGLTINYKNDYTIEIDYKFWQNTVGGNDGTNSHSLFLGLVKKF